MISFRNPVPGNSGRAPRAFLDDRSGNVAMLFSLTIIPLMGIAGVAMDYAGALRHKAHLQNVVDMAALAGSTAKRNGGSDNDARTMAQNYVLAHYAVPGSSTPTVSSSVSASGALILSATTNVDTYLTRLFDTVTIPVTARSEVTTDAGKLEIAIALDTTGSMDPGNKLVDAKKAASDLIDQVVGPSGVNPLVKISLVPFNYYVNIGTTFKGASWLSNSEDRAYAAGCYDTYPSAVYGTPIDHWGYVDGVYKIAWTEYPVISQGAPVSSCWPAGVDSWVGTVGSRNYPLDLLADVSAANPVPAMWWVASPQTVVRLTNNAAAVKAQISSLSAASETFIAPGVLWAWRTLSPNAPFSDGAAYGTGTKKIMILMTDGANTHSPNYPDHEGTNVADANDITKKTCANAKALGIVIYTIAFQVTDVTIKGILQDCASAPVNYYDATSNAAMLAAFKEIANNLTQLRVSK